MSNEVVEGAIIPFFVYDKLNHQPQSEKVNNHGWRGGAGELFSVVRPEMSKEMEREVREMVREMPGEARLLPAQE